ncbi:MAG: hypothetical protein ACREMO_10850 [Gemmatimonadales bacterium]
MSRLGLIAMLALSLGACRNYDYSPTISNQRGLVPPDQFARYGREQAISVAIGREFARPYNSGLGMQTEIAIKYAKRFPDVVDVVADSLGHRLTVRFKSGWRTAIVPINDGKTGADTKIPS